jgi:hypothetical protein
MNAPAHTKVSDAVPSTKRRNILVGISTFLGILCFIVFFFVVSSLSTEKETYTIYIWSIVAAVGLGAIAVIAFYWGSRIISADSRKASMARDQIVNYLKDKNFKMMSFERIRKNIRQDYSDEFLGTLPDYFPNDLRKAVIKDKNGGGRKPGLARIIREEAVEGTAGESADA